MKKLLVSAILASLLSAETINGVAVLVQDRPITLHELQRYAQKERVSIAQSTDTLIRKKLEEIEAEKRGIFISSSDVLKEITSMAEQSGMNVTQYYAALQSNRGISQSDFQALIKEKLLNQKLYDAVAFSKMSRATPEEEAEYYKLHINEFSKPDYFKVIAYRSVSQERLSEKVNNPMYYSPDIEREEVTLKYHEINPQLAMLLSQTKTDTFSAIVPSPDGGFMSFFIQEKGEVKVTPLESVRPMVANAIAGEKRRQILNDYFARLQLNSKIKVIRTP